MSNPFHVTFFNQLQSTRESGTCPKCGASNLEVRRTGPQRRAERYVLHCGSVQTVLTGERLKVALVLIADRELAEVGAIARADAIADFELMAREGGL